MSSWPTILPSDPRHVEGALEGGHLRLDDISCGHGHLEVESLLGLSRRNGGDDIADRSGGISGDGSFLSQASCAVCL